MAFTYCLPDVNGEKQEFETTSNAIVIIGANGAGKSKLGAWIEQQDLDNVHRIGAQRDLNFGENIPLKNYTEAENLVFYGTAEEKNIQANGKGFRWNWGKSYTTKMLDDFENVLAALIALNNNQIEDYFKLCRKAEETNNEKPPTPQTVLDKLLSVWKDVLPQRKLVLDDGRFFASVLLNGEEIKYSAPQMSDGERAVLYLIAQVLCVPPQKTMIIDEPEVHLHPSIMNRLWNALENCRKDCLFIYLTHDTQFAANHKYADKIWIKEFNGQTWKLEKLEDMDLPEDLLFEILGSRKNVLFVEGDRNSHDTQLYTELYPNYIIIPCGSCLQVISRTRAFRDNLSLHDYEVYGIIDRDYRTDYEIEKFEKDNIFTINVAEVENLFIVKELIYLMAEHMGKDSDEVFSKVKKYVVEERFANQINSQICEATVASIKYRLMSIKISKDNDAEAKASLENGLESIDYERIREEQEEKFSAILQSNDYTRVIEVFNEKRLAVSVGHYFGITNKEYCKTIISLLRGKKHEEIINALKHYLPKEIPR